MQASTPSSASLPSNGKGTSDPTTGPTFEQVFPKGVELSQAMQDLFEEKRRSRTALTFDELTLEDKPSDFHPNDVNLRSFVTRRIALKGAGILSAAMDTVTEENMALSMAQMGGLGVLHRNLSPEAQAAMVKWVRKKIHSGGMIDRPIVFHPEDHYSQLQAAAAKYGWTFTSFPIVAAASDTSTESVLSPELDHRRRSTSVKKKYGRLLGMVTRDEMEFIDSSANPRLGDMMIPRSNIVTAPEGTDSTEAYAIMKERKVKKLPIVDKDDNLIGMYVWSDVRNDQRKKKTFSLDDKGHFLVAAAIGMGNEDIERARLLVESGCRVLVVDSSHGACKPARNTLKALQELKNQRILLRQQQHKATNSPGSSSSSELDGWGDFEVIVGNIASYDSAMYLLESDAKPDALKVGIGPGSICTTRQVTGHGVPQATALYEVWRAVRDYGAKTGFYVPIIADGGIRSSGDIVKCFACGASGVMLGSALAGTTESPGQVVVSNGKQFKTIRGMGSRSAMAERSGSRGRYHRQSSEQHVTEGLTKAQAEKMVAEGVEGLVEYKGSLERVMLNFLGGIQSGLAHTGANNVPAFQRKATAWVQGPAGALEGKPHDIHNIRD
ncbi:Inosine-5'-monophosphate dehydrogenase [Balamuthia mandrillaris]